MKRALMVMLLGVVMHISPLAQGPPPNPGVNIMSAIAAGPTDPKEFEAWMDRFLADYLKRSSASLGFILVKDGKIFFQKGYGFADAEKKTPVVPDQTLFYAASVSKLLTATAVMQLIEQGKLKPDADINTYLHMLGKHIGNKFFSFTLFPVCYIQVDRSVFCTSSLLNLLIDCPGYFVAPSKLKSFGLVTQHEALS